MISYNYDNIKRYTPFELYKYEKDDFEKTIKDITGTIKYNLHDRTESMCAATTDPKKTLFTIKLPLGSS
ncbi:MAG: hypothetical protein FWD71_22990, partial [Oscillospiraceae bacterium]|nr:hypothetical protein [Oscillospiraceae bacterium]